MSGNPLHSLMQNGQAEAADNGHAHGMLPLTCGPADILCVPPSLIVDAPGLRVWHKLDQTFRHVLPAFCVQTPVADSY